MELVQTYNQKLTRALDTRPVIIQILRFAAIGTLNTALDFIILNYLTKSLGITSGIELGLINMVGFAAATVQSYFWNRVWTFSASNISALRNAFRLMVVGGFGFLAFLLVFLGSIYSVVENYYLFVLVVFIIGQLVIWYGFGLELQTRNNQGVGQQFASFLVVSLVGLMINSGIVAVASYALAPVLANLINADTIKNVAKVLATCVSLIWNFIGYKLIVFKR